MQQFNNTPHDYEITLQRDSVIEICPPDDVDAQGIPDVMFNVSGKREKGCWLWRMDHVRGLHREDRKGFQQVSLRERTSGKGQGSEWMNPLLHQTLTGVAVKPPSVSCFSLAAYSIPPLLPTYLPVPPTPKTVVPIHYGRWICRCGADRGHHRDRPEHRGTQGGRRRRRRNGSLALYGAV